MTYSATSEAESSFNFCPAIENSRIKTVEGAAGAEAGAEAEAEEFEFPMVGGWCRDKCSAPVWWRSWSITAQHNSISHNDAKTVHLKFVSLLLEKKH